MTAQQPLNNIVRGTIGALAAVIGGTQTLIVSGFDEALGLPSHEAMRLQLRTQQIIAHESGVWNTADPMGGSYYVESLTDEIERRTMEYFEKIEKMGGSLKAIESGFYDREITRSAYEYLKEVESGRRVVVGVNQYQVDEKQHFRAMEISAAEERRQVRKVRKLRLERDNSQVKSSLKRLREAAKDGVNLVDPLLETVKTYATIGEMCDVLAEVWGRHRKPGILL